MTWTKQAAHSLTEALSGPLDTDGVIVAAAAIDSRDTSIADIPAGTVGHGRFEIGSVTKTMTAATLALLVREGAVRLEDEIGRWLSAGANGTLTIGQLATHTSGLPSMPPNLRLEKADPRNPWAGYGFEQAEAGLRQATVTPGHQWRYSNLGYQLLGLILQRATRQDYPTLITQRLLDPLGMTHSGVGPGGQGRLVTGHADGRPAPRWEHPLGAGGVEATIGDLARYTRACLFPATHPPLGEAITLAQTPVLRIDNETEQALAWIVRDGIREHSGGTGGFSACVTIDHPRERAAAILVNTQGSPAYSSHLKQAARLVLAGDDPRRAQAPQPWPTWQDDVHTLIGALVDGRIAHVHARLAPQAGEKITLQRLENAWTKRIQPAGPAQDITIAHHDIAASGAVVAEIAISFAKGPQRLRVIILPTGQLGGLAFIP